MAKVISSASAKKALAKVAPEIDSTDQETAQEIAQEIALGIAQDQTKIGGYGYQIICQQSQQIAKLKAPVLSDQDPENLHQMRIATRRLRAALLLFSDSLHIRSEKGKKKPAEAIAKAVKRLTQSLGSVRDLDVMQAWFGDALKSAQKDNRFNKKEKKTIQALLKTIKKRRQKRALKLEKTLRGDRYKKLIGQFTQWAKQPAFTEAAQASAAEAAAAKIVAPLTALIQHPAWLMASHQIEGSRQADEHIDPPLAPISTLTLAQLNQELEQNGEALHDLRKCIKQVRYQAEFFRGLYGVTYAAQVREFRMLQKILGNLQDQIVVSQFLSDELGKNWAKKLPTIAADFQNSRLALWEQWQPYQKKYLKLRGPLESPLPDSEQVA